MSRRRTKHSVVWVPSDTGVDFNTWELNHLTVVNRRLSAIGKNTLQPFGMHLVINTDFPELNRMTLNALGEVVGTIFIEVRKGDMFNVEYLDRLRDFLNNLHHRIFFHRCNGLVVYCPDLHTQFANFGDIISTGWKDH